MSSTYRRGLASIIKMYLIEFFIIKIVFVFSFFLRFIIIDKSKIFDQLQVFLYENLRQNLKFKNIRNNIVQ